MIAGGCKVKTVLCFGDSNTYGWDPMTLGRYAPDIRWPGVLQKELGPEYRVVEEGCGCRTAVMDDGLETFVNGSKYFEPCLRSHCPLDAVVIMLGTNDLKRRFGLSATDIAGGVGVLAGMVSSVLRFEQNPLPQILLISPIHLGEKIVENEVNYELFDFEHGIETSKKLAVAIRQTADKYGCSFLDAAEFAKPSEADSVHMMPEGHLTLGRAVARKLEEMFGEPAKR